MRRGLSHAIHEYRIEDCKLAIMQKHQADCKPTRLCSHSSRDDDNIRSAQTMQTSVKIHSISNELITLLVCHIGQHSLRRCYPRDTSCAAKAQIMPCFRSEAEVCPVLCLEAQVVPRFVPGFLAARTLAPRFRAEA
jgi:hypothetical protein